MTQSNQSMVKRLFQFVILTLTFILIASPSIAAPSVASVDPAIGQVGQDLEVTILGSGFTQNSRVLMYPDSGNSMKKLGAEDTLYAMRNIAVVCNTAYVTAESYFQIVDVSRSTDPVLMSTRSLPSYGMAIAVQNNLAYILTEQHGLLIFDVQNPLQPVKLGEAPIPYGSHVTHYGISLAGQFVYAANGSTGLYIIDVSSPENPEVVGHGDTFGKATGVSVSGQWAYVSVYEFGLRVFDISNPKAPVQRGFLQTSLAPGEMDVAVVGQTAYVIGIVDDLDGIHVINIIDPTKPSLVTSIPTTSGFNFRITVEGNRAYIAVLDFGLQVIDVSDPPDPVFLGSIKVPGFATDIAIANDLAYLTADNLEIIDVTNITRSSILSSEKNLNWAEGVAVQGSTAFLADLAGLHLYDITDPFQPGLKASVPSPGFAHDVFVQDNIAYITYDYGLLLIDITDEENPVPIENGKNPVVIGTSLPTGSDSWEVVVANKIAYVAASVFGLQIIDVDPASDTYLDIIGTLDTYNDDLAAVGISVVGNTAYLADIWVGLCIVDVTDPETPELLSSFDPIDYDINFGGTKGVVVADNIAYLALQYGGFLTVDVSDSGSPSALGDLGTLDIDGYDVILAGQTAYLASRWQGVHVIDVSNPIAPLFLAAIPTFGYAADLAIIDNLLVVANTIEGFCILAAPQEIDPVLDTGTPDSKMTATLPADFKGDYTVKILDNTGSDELPGAVTFMTQLPKSKAVIVAGYGPHASNRLWDETLLNANYAWNVLFDQGYLQENIRYLSPVTSDANNDGTPDVTGDATLAELELVLTTWAADADDLIVYLVGHGGKGSFVMKHTDTVHEELADQVLAGWLDGLQASIEKRAILVYEACYSGSFLPAMQLDAGDSFERAVITSSNSNQVSIAGNKGVTSFSHRFWESVLEQGELVQAFADASSLMSGFGQISWLDGNCDGYPNTPADRSRQTTVGRGYNFRTPLKPIISCASADQQLGKGNSALFWAKTVSSNPISRVWAEIILPNYDPIAPDAIELPTFDLSWSNSRQRYEGVYDQFNEPGTYFVTVYALDDQQIVSMPKIGKVTVTSFCWNLFLPAITGRNNLHAGP